tara:strand:+ start:1238 stop:1543 length:306 start_codon:yes stop_codon:yes gene_type:complete
MDNLSQLSLNKLKELTEKYNCTTDEVVDFLHALSSPRENKGLFLVERTILYLIKTNKKSRIDTPMLRKMTGANFNTVEKVKKAYEQEIKKHNQSLVLEFPF